MTKIETTDTVQEAIIKMSDGNPGAVRVLCDVINNGRAIDPDSAMGSFGSIAILDMLEIYGSGIWMLYKDVCGEDIVKMIAVLRAWQIGLVSASTITYAMENRGDGLDVDDVLSRVQERLPDFGKE